MDYNLLTNIQICHQFKELAPMALVRYSHIPTAIVAILIGLFVFSKNRSSLLSRILMAITFSFALWSFLDLLNWEFGYNGILTMFSWALLGMTQIIMFISCLYFVYTFPKDEAVPFFKKITALMLMLPVIILTPTVFNLTSFDIANCEASEGLLFTSYYHYLSLAIFFWILAVIVFKYRRVEKKLKKQILLMGLGIELFLLAFFATNLLASLLDDYTILIYGMFGMVVFLAFLAYLIVKFKAFNIKLIGAQALIVSLIILIGSQFFFIQNNTNRVLTAITLFLVVGFGWMLIRSVKKEIAQKEELQKISDSLVVANDRLQKLSDSLVTANVKLKELDNAKSEFISIASHQLRTPLTAIKGYISLLLEGSYGKMPMQIQDILDKVYGINNRLVRLVEDLLNVSRIESGRIQYAFAPTKLEPLVAELVDMFMPAAKNKHLTLSMQLPASPLPLLTIDANKMKEVVSNLIDNALNYTKEGSVSVSMASSGSAVRIIVSDTGIGIKPEDKGKLFTKFSRSNETTKMVVSGTGLGLYVGKNFVEGHGGKIFAESDGPNRGSRFIIELPFVNPNVGKDSVASFKESYKK